MERAALSAFVIVRTFLSRSLDIDWTGGCGRKPPGRTLMGDTLLRFWADLVARIDGPMSFRVVLQPMVAIALGIRAGIVDARTGKPLYFFALLTSGVADRRRQLRQGWRDVARVFVLALIMDAAYQILEYRWLYPVEMLIVAFLLACVPYLAVRGPANWAAAALRRERS
jgi:hypothetical protein